MRELVFSLHMRSQQSRDCYHHRMVAILRLDNLQHCVSTSDNNSCRNQKGRDELCFPPHALLQITTKISRARLATSHMKKRSPVTRLHLLVRRFCDYCVLTASYSAISFSISATRVGNRAVRDVILECPILPAENIEPWVKPDRLVISLRKSILAFT